MKKNLFLIFYLFALTIFAQKNEINYSFGEFTFSENTEAYLFGNNVRLRNEPNTESIEIDKLGILTKIIILEKTENSQIINGVKSNWVKIQAQDKIGYILDNFISCSFLSTDSTIYLSRIIKENKSYFLDIRKIDSRKLKANAVQIKFKIPHSNISVKSYGNKGISNISNIIFIEYLSEACMMPGGGKYLFLKNGEIIIDIELSKVSEAGMFWHTEKLIFPESDKNIEDNTIKFIREYGNVVDESSQWYETKIVERQYKIIENKLVPEFDSKSE
jgi:hypothetical protein